VQQADSCASAFQSHPGPGRDAEIRATASNSGDANSPYPCPLWQTPQVLVALRMPVEHFQTGFERCMARTPYYGLRLRVFLFSMPRNKHRHSDFPPVAR